MILKVEIKFPKCGVLSDFYLGKEITSRILTKRKGVFGFQLTLKKDDFDLELKPTLELISFAKNLPITERVNRIRVTNSSESETALFPAKKVQNPPPIFPIKKVTLHACNFYCIFMWQLIPYPLKTAKKFLILILFQDSSKTVHPK